MNKERLRAGMQRIAMILLLAASWGTVRSQSQLYHNEFPAEDVQLLDGAFKHARDLNMKVLLQYEPDRLLAGYRTEAGLPAKGKKYPNWEGLDGHVAGHYLSALAMNYAATKNDACKQRMDYVLRELEACRQANALNHPTWGKGYVGSVPGGDKIWSSFKKGDFASFRAAWVPWYNIHKMYAGLRDAWLYTGNKKARDLFLSFCDWAIAITDSLTETQMQSMLDVEHGGMNEILADACQVSGEKKYLAAAKRFSHRVLLDAMAAGKDNLDNKHANTQVPKAIGFERIGEIGDDEAYRKAGDFFWQTVTQHRSLALGGNSRREFFPPAAASIDFVNEVEGPESCNSYNMLKLTAGLFRINASAAYMDYYERTLYNHILSTQHPQHGGYVYFTPARPRSYRVYSAPNQGMWCCVGSGMENHGKYNEFIYTHRDDSLFLNLFIASTLDWKSRGIKIKQETLFPFEEKTRLTITEGAGRFSLLVRYPSWVADGALRVLVNGKAISYSVHPSSYVAIQRTWKKGDVVQVMLPMHTSVEQLPNVPNYIAILHGPVLLGAKTGTEDLKGLVADDGRWSHIPSGKRLPLNKAPVFVEDDRLKIAKSLVPVKNKPLHFTFSNLDVRNLQGLELEPFYQIHDARYMMYWMVLDKAQYKSYTDSIAAEEKNKITLQQRTVDFVAPGEQQPEADHLIKKQNSNTGNYQNEFWRDARDDGFFSYTLATNNESGLNLIVRYWGNERGNRKFDIFIDEEKLVTENIADKWNLQQFRDVEYVIPEAMLKGKKEIRVAFRPQPGNIAGAIYYIRLARKQ